MSHFITYIFVRIGVYLFYIVPFSVLYIISDFIAFLLQFVFRYRLFEINNNIHNALSGLSENEFKLIRKNCYKNLSDILLEGLKGLTMSRAQMRKRYSFVNPELVDQFANQRRSVIITGAHVGNWEWAVISLNDWIIAQAVGVFKPVSNKLVEKYLNSKRNKLGTRLIPTEQSRNAFQNGLEENDAFLLWGDQSPANPRNAHWFPIFGIETAWTHGADTIARQFDYPVFYCKTKRIKRGYYQNTFFLLSENPSQTSPTEITRLFVQKVEESILENPSDWLWSHKRWKHKRSILQSE
ncbi:MAG: lysophospholipid acyltransferase family protein [Saprospiraceae bacterium]